MSRFRDALLAAHPHWSHPVPEPLERAWSWLEEQGFGSTDPDATFLSPCPPEAGSGAEFVPDLTLEGWFDEGTPAHDVLLPVATVAGDGTMAVLWVEGDATRVVALGSEGSGHVLAEDSADFLRLLAVGYDELEPFLLGVEPDDAEVVEAHAPFRSWVEGAFREPVPDLWPAVGDDRFSAWVDEQLGADPTPATPATDAPHTSVEGDAALLLALLRRPDDADTASRVAEVTGAKVGATLRRSTRGLATAGVEVIVDRAGLQTVFVTLADYGRPDEVVRGLTPASTMQDALDLLGEPERISWEFPFFARFRVGDGYVHLAFNDDEDRLEQVTVTTYAP